MCIKSIMILNKDAQVYKPGHFFIYFVIFYDLTEILGTYQYNGHK